jgi:hypothetical protein
VETSSPCFSDIMALYISYKKKNKSIIIKKILKKSQQILKKKTHNECFNSVIYELLHPFPHIQLPYMSFITSLE